MPNDLRTGGPVSRPKSGRLKKWAIRGLVLTGAVAFVAYLALGLRSAPDVGEPFDVEAFASFTLPDAQNAITYYRRAAASYVNEDTVFASSPALKHEDFWNSLEATEKNDWDHAIPAVRSWVALNRPAFGEWKRGADCGDSLEVCLADPSKVSWLWTDWSKLHGCARVQVLDGIRLTAERHAAEAWEHFQVLLRAGRHLTMHASIIGTTFGLAISDSAVQAAVNWSSEPSVKSAELKRAIRDVLKIDEMGAPASDTLKIEYLGLRHIAETGEVFGTTDAAWMRSTGYPAQVGLVARLVVANLLTQVDRPRYLRTNVHPGDLHLFELDPAAAPDPKLRPPDEIEAAAITNINVVSRVMGWISSKRATEIGVFDPNRMTSGLSNVCLWHDVDQTRRAGLLLALALQLHYREHHEFPASLEDLVKDGYLNSIPADPFGKGEPFHYRREADHKRGAVLWSVYTDEIDQNGAELHGDNGDWDIHVRVPRTADSAAK
jgi:hypothetical protein